MILLPTRRSKGKLLQLVDTEIIDDPITKSSNKKEIGIEEIEAAIVKESNLWIHKLKNNNKATYNL